ncbi:MAG: biotin--[acetyl-CoA-carboxylase] ligase [Spirochaeta sp.]|nr:biotin--[acetyl-CoA-carboxylase] ligase [Spirochaeta sp.]
MRKLDLENAWQGAPLFLKYRTQSTMEDAEALAGKGYPEGTVVAASFQERGRGRLPGRLWESVSGKNLLFTLLLRNSSINTLSRLPLLIGLAVSLALEKLFSLETEIKWPNDILFQGRKLCGLFCMAGSDRILAGIGINCNQLSFAENLGGRATSLAVILKKRVSRQQVLVAVLREVKAVLADRDWQAKILKRLYLRGREAVILEGLPPGREVRGIVVGLEPDGALLIRTEAEAEPLRVVSGEITG